MVRADPPIRRTRLGLLAAILIACWPAPTRSATAAAEEPPGAAQAAAGGLPVPARPASTAAPPGVSRPLVARGDAAYPPFEFIGEDGRATGFNVELLQAVAQVMGLDLDISLGPWDVVRGQLEQGEIDVITGMYYSAERDLRVEFSTPFTVVYSSLFVMGDDNPVASESDLSAYTVVVQKGDIWHDTVLANGSVGHILTAGSPADVLRRLAAGEAEVAILPKIQGLYLARELGLDGVRAVGPPLLPREYAFAVREGRRDLVAALNQGLAILEATGRYRELQQRWFGVLEPAPTTPTEVARYLLWGLLPFLVLLVGWAVWTRSLRRQVAERTRDLESELAERRRAEEALAGEREQLDVTLRSIGDAVITTDADGRVTLLNPVAVTLTGWSLDATRGQALTRVFDLRPVGSDAPVDDVVARVRAADAVVSLDDPPGRLIALDGRERLVSGCAAPIRDPEGRFRGVVVAFRDITSRRRLEEELARAEKLESLGVMAGGIAHDFNNILAAVTGNLSLATAGLGRDDALRAHLESAAQATLRARDLTQQLLTFARGGAPVKRPTRLGEVVRDAAALALSGSNVRCELALAPDLWPAEVDGGQIAQAVQNLVLNAAQAMPQGGTVTVRADNTTLEPGSATPLPPGPYVRVSVCDRGPGIARDILARVFEPFFTTKRHGSGLGLATTYSVVSRHGGWIGVTSEPGAGAAFTFYLPARPGAAIPVLPAAPAAPVRHDAGRVLVMDDEEVVRAVAAAMLQRLGFEVVAVADGAAAVTAYGEALAADDRFDAVIMDLTVPGGMGGREALERLRALDPGVCAIVSSGYSNDPIMANHESFGFRGVIAKPYRLEDMSAALAAVRGPAG